MSPEDPSIRVLNNREHKITVPVAFDVQEKTFSFKEYQEKYQASLQDPEAFWSEIAKDFFWYQPASRALPEHWEQGDPWFAGATTNLSVNCLDRHLPQAATRMALLWEGNRAEEQRSWTYQALHEEVCRLANVLKRLGVQKGDRVVLYLGMVPELAFALLACARIGAIHSVVFGGFSAASLKNRILDCEADFLLTADGLFRGEKTVPLKASVDEALEQCEAQGHFVKACLVLRRTGDAMTLKAKRDHDWANAVAGELPECEPEPMCAEDPLFILYTSGSTGKPKGLYHGTGGYMVYAGTTFAAVFPQKTGDVFWCTADLGWVTGHSYGLYGPLLNGATTLLYEGVPNSPDPERICQIVERHSVATLYTAPTLIRSLMREPDERWARYPMESLRLLGSVGEPINPEAWRWYFEKIGKGRCPIVDTWWQTETGGILLTTLPWSAPMKPGAAGFPLFGVLPRIVDNAGQPSASGEGGHLTVAAPWPGMAQGIYGDAARFRKSYFSAFPGSYDSGDGAYQDSEGYFWLLGRLDDVLNVSGHRLGTAELESAFVQHPKVAEAAVVGSPHPLKGQGIYAFLTLKAGAVGDRSLRRELVQHIAQLIGAIAKPDHVQFTAALPKTRSGKILRRLLRKIASDDTADLGDTSTLAEPEVIARLLKEKLESFREN